jgi:hypothetical protein
MRAISAIVAGTGFDNRARLIRAHCKVNPPVTLQREPNNSHDSNAIAVYLHTSFLFGLLKSRAHIGYVKASRASSMAPKIDSGELRVVGCVVASFFAPPDLEHPRVSLTIQVEP